MDFSVRLKELRTDNDMSQTELADKLNLKASAISKYEKGITQPAIETLKKLAEIFCVTVDYLIGLSDIRNPYGNTQITPNEAELVEHFRQLSYENKIRIDERIKTIIENNDKR
ncbi:MAG: helix-turn-helix transcriptional regulator [Ruminococcus sp.]|nr:helix-turn-helix transcriptional regulator [Ruminococcus sp.]